MRYVLRLVCLLVPLVTATLLNAQQRQMEALGRGLVAIVQPNGQVYLSWRLLGTDPDELAFNVYRTSAQAGTGLGTTVKLNATPLTQTTDLIDTNPDLTLHTLYTIRPVLKGVEQLDQGWFSLSAGSTPRPYLRVPLMRPPDGVNSGGTYTYSANDTSVGDLDGNGEYELVVKWDPSNAKDNSQSGITGNVYLDAYKLNGTRLWRIDLGRNIRAGAHYTQFMVYDLDGDGSAEVACKTADGTVDGVGNVIGDPNADHRNGSGYILTGPEFLTIFSGRTGAALATVPYLPARTSDPTRPPAKAEWGDDYGNRVDRFLAAVAYTDGRRPTLIMCRGYYTRAVLVAWNWRDGQLTRAWTFDSDDGTTGNSSYRGQGNHNLSVADVDDDGRDEIIYGSCAIDDDGKPLHLTRLGHGDAMHVSDLDPERPGLEVFQCHEDVDNNGGVGLSFRDAKTGSVIWTVKNTDDTGRAVAIDIDPTRPGYECWGAVGGLYDAKGAQISTQRPSWMNFAIWWDADPLREILDGTRINKWNWTDRTESRLLTADGSSINGTKANPCLSGDIIGDWREELVVRSTDSSEMRIYTTTIPATNRIYTLMHDPQYRLAIAWQNVAYNQPPHPGFFLGNGMGKPPTPLIRTVGTSAMPSPSRLVNLSVLAPAGIGDDTLIVGFGVAGGSRSFLVRGIGPTLSTFSVSGPVADPDLKLYSAAGSLLSSNGDWSTGSEADNVFSTSASVGAFPLPRPSRDSAMVSPLEAGGYTVHVGIGGGTPGPALVELYAVGDAAPANLNNVSVRARVGGSISSGPLITGFVVRGPTPRTVLIRAVGPQLALYGVGGTLSDPQITLYRGDTKLSENDNWGRDSGAIASTFGSLGGFPLASGSKDAALLVTLPEGNYSVHTSSANGGSGIVLVEVYTVAD